VDAFSSPRLKVVHTPARVCCSAAAIPNRNAKTFSREYRGGPAELLRLVSPPSEICTPPPSYWRFTARFRETWNDGRRRNRHWPGRQVVDYIDISPRVLIHSVQKRARCAGGQLIISVRGFIFKRYVGSRAAVIRSRGVGRRYI